MGIITVIFATRNGAATLPIMLRSLTELDTDEDWALIAVNNASSDETACILDEFRERLPLTVLNEPIPGKNRALNRALDHAQGDLIVFTDDDIIAAPDWLRQLRNVANEQPSYDIFGGHIAPHWQAEPPSVVLENAPLGITYAITPAEQATGPVFPGLVWGPNMAVRRRVFEAGHRFNDAVGPSGGNYIMGSETEFTIRAAENGYLSWHTNDARVQHIIRPHQIEPEWVIRRAYRFGRNQWHQIGPAGPGPTLFGIPRWRFSSYAQQWLKGFLALLSRDRNQLFQSRWERSFLRGYLKEGLKRRNRNE